MPKLIDIRSLGTWLAKRFLMMIGTGVLALAAWLSAMSSQVATIQEEVETFAAYIEKHDAAVSVIVAQNQAQRADASSKLDRLLKYVEEDRIRDLTVEGAARPGLFGPNEAYVVVNRRSDAKEYREGDEMHITILNGDVENQTRTLKVLGTFVSKDRDLVVVFSQKACQDLGITSEVEVHLEPVLTTE